MPTDIVVIIVHEQMTEQYQQYLVVLSKIERTYLSHKLHILVGFKQLINLTDKMII